MDDDPLGPTGGEEREASQIEMEGESWWEGSGEMLG